MKKENIKIIKRKTAELIGAEYNPRQLSVEQFNQLKDSLNRFGFVDPILVNMNKDRENIVIGGHSRLKVATELGYTEVPCVELNLSLDQEKELNIRLNKNTGSFDFDMLANHFETDELIDWGFTNEELSFFEIDDIGEEEYPDLGDGTDSPIKTMTLTLSVDQAELIESAISEAKDKLDCTDVINENTNGNAVHAIVRAWANG